MDENTTPSAQAGQLQEAIDMISQTFGYPESLTIRYTTVDREKRTKFEIETSGKSAVFELRYSGGTDDGEPVLTQMD